MVYRINLGAWNGVFAVPCEVVDSQLRLAGAAQLRVLLYILRHGGQAVEPGVLSAAVGLTEGDCADAVEYWRRAGILIGDADALLPGNEPKALATAPQHAAAPDKPVSLPGVAAFDEPAAVSASARLTGDASAPESTNEPCTTETAAPHPSRAKERIRYSYSECMEMLGDDDELRKLLPTLEYLLSKQLNHTEISVFITLVKWYGLPPCCVALLVEYCRDIGKPSIAYIEATGIGWSEEDIVTVERADAKITQLHAARSACSTVLRLLDAPDRLLSKKDQELCGIWINEWHTDSELIVLAYDRCIESKGKLSLRYINGILANWRKAGILTAEQARVEQTAQKDKPSAAKDKSATGRYSATYNIADADSIMEDDWGD